MKRLTLNGKIELLQVEAACGCWHDAERLAREIAEKCREFKLQEQLEQRRSMRRLPKGFIPGGSL